MYLVRRDTYFSKKRGEAVKYQGRKAAKTTNHLMLCDNKYHILAISDGISGNHHASFNLVENFAQLLAHLDQSHVEYRFSHLNADTGFDVQVFIQTIEEKHQLIANIPRNKRNAKKIIQETRYLSDYIYSFRFKIEIVFAWLDTYKRILIRFEYRNKHFKAWLLLAASLINLRTIFN